MKVLTALLLTLGCSTVALADNEKGLYAGAGVGQFNLEANDIEDVAAALSSFDSDDTSFKVFAGWRFSPYIAVELAYIDFGKPDDDIDGLNVEAGLNGFAPSLIGTLPLGPIELFAKVGYLFYDLDIDVGGQEIASVSGSDEDLIYGAGIGITLFERLNARLEYEIIDISDVVDDANAIWLTGAWRF